MVNSLHNSKIYQACKIHNCYNLHQNKMKNEKEYQFKQLTIYILQSKQKEKDYRLWVSYKDVYSQNRKLQG